MASVGVDVMRINDSHALKNVPEFFRLMRRQFTAAEWAAIRSAGDAAPHLQLAEFYRHWCLKESFVKAEGTGLAWDLQRLNFQVFNLGQLI